MASVIQSDVIISGALTPQTINYPAASINNASIGASAAIAATKMQQQRNITYAQASGSAVAAETKVVHNQNGATGTITKIEAGLAGVIPSGDKTVTVDVKKNGTTVLSATVVLDSANVLRTAEAGAVSVSSLVADDILEVVVTIAGSTGTDPKGLFVSIVLTEDPA